MCPFHGPCASSLELEEKGPLHAAPLLLGKPLQKGCLEIQHFPLDFFKIYLFFWSKPEQLERKESSHVLVVWSLLCGNRAVSIVKVWSVHVLEVKTRRLLQRQTHWEDIAWLVKTWHLAQQEAELPWETPAQPMNVKGKSPATSSPSPILLCGHSR